MRILPENMRASISIAYLLARAADSIADTALVPPETRRSYLLTFISQLDSPHTAPTIQLEQFKQNENPSEAMLLQQLPQVFSLYNDCAPNDKLKIAKVVTTLIKGMLMDLDTFPSEQSRQIKALSTPEELDRYTYLVAGCVGEFWTDLCITHDPACRHWKTDELYQLQKERGIRLGKALQLTNVLRDVAKDLQIGRCYLPEQQLKNLNLTPETLLSNIKSDNTRPLLTHWLNQALEHFQSGIEYGLLLPRTAIRQRLAVFWPILIGLATLNKLIDNENWLIPDKPIKVSRSWVYRMILISLFACTSNKAMRHWFKKLQSSIHV